MSIIDRKLTELNMVVRTFNGEGNSPRVNQKDKMNVKVYDCKLLDFIERGQVFATVNTNSEFGIRFVNFKYLRHIL